MEATRTRFGSIVEWLIAAAFIAAILAVTAVAFPQFGSVRIVTAVPVEEVPAPDGSAMVPSRAVSVPILLFGDGHAVHIGDRVSDVLSSIGTDAQVGEDAIERVAGHERLTRLYEHVGTKFALVFESVAPSSEPRVVGIYKQ